VKGAALQVGPGVVRNGVESVHPFGSMPRTTSDQWRRRRHPGDQGPDADIEGLTPHCRHYIDGILAAYSAEACRRRQPPCRSPTWS